LKLDMSPVHSLERFRVTVVAVASDGGRPSTVASDGGR